jgi:two-component system, NtrC family, nitrogen regulation response regulator NtrX
VFLTHCKVPLPYTGFHPFLSRCGVTASGDILIIEDDTPISDFIAEVLEDEGYTVRSAHDRAAALTILANHLPNLILCDLHLPGVSSLTLIDDIRSAAGTAVPLVVMTADVQAARQLDMQGIAFCLLKPFSLEDLVSCVTTHMPPQRLGWS